MKNHLLPVLLSVLCFAGCTSVSNPTARHVLETKVPFVVDLPPEAGDHLEPVFYDPFYDYSVEGMTETGVLRMLGRPTERLTPEFWVYWQYYSPEQAKAAGGYDTVIVAFEGGKLTHLKLVSGADLHAELARRQPPAVASRL